MENYQFKGMKLIPSIAEKLIIDFWGSEKMRSRKDIINSTISEHRKRGGSMDNVDPIACMKKALSSLRKKNLIEKKVYGTYVLKPTATPDSQEAGQKTVDDVIPEDAVQLTPDSMNGKGDGCVYVYYYPVYKAFAEFSREKRWRCKIGLSTIDASMRVNQQTGTSMPEKPVIALVLKTDKPSELEKALHSILSIRGHRSEDSPGQEWFLTNPEEVKGLYSFITDGQGT
jgi:hypothetical protein